MGKITAPKSTTNPRKPQLLKTKSTTKQTGKHVNNNNNNNNHHKSQNTSINNTITANHTTAPTNTSHDMTTSTSLLTSPLQPTNATARRRHRRKRAELEKQIRQENKWIRIQSATLRSTWSRLKAALNPRTLAQNTWSFGKFMYHILASPFTTPHHIQTLLQRVTALEQELAIHRQRHAIIMHDLKRAVRTSGIRDVEPVRIHMTPPETSIPAAPVPMSVAPEIPIPPAPAMDVPMAPPMDIPPPPCAPDLLSLPTSRPLVIKKSSTPAPPKPEQASFSIALSDITSIKLRSHTERVLPQSSPLKSDGRPIITLQDITSVKLKKLSETPNRPLSSPPSSATRSRARSDGIDLQEMLNHKLKKSTGTNRSPGGTPIKTAPVVPHTDDTNSFLIQKLSEKFKRSPVRRALSTHNMQTISEHGKGSEVTPLMITTGDKENHPMTRTTALPCATPGARYHATFSTISNDSPSTPWLNPATRSPFIPRGRD